MINSGFLDGLDGTAAKRAAIAALEAAGAGVVFEPERPEALAEAAIHLATMDGERRSAMGEAGRRFYAERLAFDIGVAAIERELRIAAGRA